MRGRNPILPKQVNMLRGNMCARGVNFATLHLIGPGFSRRRTRGASDFPTDRVK